MYDKTLTSVVYFVICTTMKCGCLLRIFPYKWDGVNKRLVTETSKILNGLYKCIEFVVCGIVAFASVRFVQTLGEDVPIRIRVMHTSALISVWGTLFFKIQFDTRGEEIKFFTNILLEDLTRMEKQKKSKARQKGEQNFISVGDIWSNILVLMSFAIMWCNPPAHASTVFSAPCSPFLLTSVLPACKSYSFLPEASEIYKFQLIHFLMIFLATIDTFLIWTFNWMVVFLGLTLIQQNIGLATKRLKENGDIEYAQRVYSNARTFLVLLRDGFATYLQISPSILFSEVGILMFGTIRYRFMEFHAYLLFPFCALRCLFDGVSLLSAAGQLNHTSRQFLNKWDKYAKDHLKKKKRLEKIRKSWKELNCSAGSLYTFENSIVLVSLHHCVQLMFNLLVTY